MRLRLREDDDVVEIIATSASSSSSAANAFVGGWRGIADGQTQGRRLEGVVGTHTVSRQVVVDHVVDLRMEHRVIVIVVGDGKVEIGMSVGG